MTVVVKLEPAAALSLREAGGATGPLGDALRRLRARLVPMHPGVDDQALASYYTVEGAGPDEDEDEEVARALRSVPGVDGAYAKPPDAPA